MRWLLRVLRLSGLLMVLAMLGFFAYQTHSEPQIRFNSLSDRLSHPFDTRVRYRIGRVDERFNLSKDDVKALAAEAANIWQQGTHRQWFVYDENAKLTINFIYDERQAETNSRQELQAVLGNLVEGHEQESQKINLARQALDAQFQDLERRLTTWQSDYDEVNVRLQNVVNDSQYRDLIDRHNQLVAQRQDLDTQVSAYQHAQEQFNDSVEHFNQQTSHINQTLTHANKVFTPREFHKGQFDGANIDIYEFESINDLRLVLAHELGHALSINHHDDPTALMYPYANEQDMENFQLKPSDIALLNRRSRWQ